MASLSPIDAVTERLAVLVVGGHRVAGDPGTTLFEPADGFADLEGFLQLAAFDPLLEFGQIGQIFRLLFFADRPILGLAAVADAQHQHPVRAREALDFHARFLLVRKTPRFHPNMLQASSLRALRVMKPRALIRPRSFARL